MKQSSHEAWEHFENFLSGFAAARELHARAGTAGAFIECVCLGTSLVDALLRVGLALKHQLEQNTRDIPQDLILSNAQRMSQYPSVKFTTERSRQRSLINPPSLSCKASTMSAIASFIGI